MKYTVLEVLTYDEWISPRASFAVIEITKEMAAWMLSVVERAKELKSEFKHFYSMRIFHNPPTWYEWDQKLFDIHDSGGETDKIPKGLDRVNVEVVTLVITNDSIKWMGSIKHTNVYCDTEQLMVGELEAIIAEA